MKQRTNASFHDFEKQSLFVGEYTGEKLVRNEDDPKDANKKKGDVMGYEFLDENGMPVIIGNSSQIEDVMNDEKDPVKKGAVCSFEFQGKSKSPKTGRTFNRFRVLEFADWNEAKKHHGLND